MKKIENSNFIIISHLFLFIVKENTKMKFLNKELIILMNLLSFYLIQMMQTLNPTYMS